MSASVDQKIPFLSEGMLEFRVAKILVEVGDEVEIGTPIIEIETDKAVIELPSDYSGKILEVCVEVDDQVNVGAVICQIDAIEEEKIEDLKAFRIKMIEILELESDAGLEVIIDAVGKLNMDNK